MTACPGCGSEKLVTKIRESGPHYAELRCSECDRHIKFLKRPNVPSGPLPVDIRALVQPRKNPATLWGSERQVSFAGTCRNSILYRAKHAGLAELHAVALCVADSSWFIANKDTSLNEVRWPRPDQMADPYPDQESA